jgi:hypothetical protein
MGGVARAADRCVALKNAEIRGVIVRSEQVQIHRALVIDVRTSSTNFANKGEMLVHLDKQTRIYFATTTRTIPTRIFVRSGDPFQADVAAKCTNGHLALTARNLSITPRTRLLQTLGVSEIRCLSNDRGI